MSVLAMFVRFVGKFSHVTTISKAEDMKSPRLSNQSVQHRRRAPLVIHIFHAGVWGLISVWAFNQRRLVSCSGLGWRLCWQLRCLSERVLDSTRFSNVHMRNECSGHPLAGERKRRASTRVIWTADGGVSILPSGNLTLERPCVHSENDITGECNFSKHSLIT